MSFEILKNNPALIRDGKLLNELIEKYEQQKSELIRLGELISEQTIFKSEYEFNIEQFKFSGPRFIFNRFMFEECNNIFKYPLYQTSKNYCQILGKFNYYDRLLTEHQFLKLFEIDQ